MDCRPAARRPIRAVETLSLLFGLLLLSVFILVPGQSRIALGCQIGGLGLLMAAVLVTRRQRVPREAGEPLVWSLAPRLSILGGTVPMIVTGISLLAIAGGSCWWRSTARQA